MVAESEQAAERLPSLLSLPQRQHAAETAYRKGATTESEQKNPVTRFIVFDERRVTVLDILRDSEARCPAGQIVGPRDKPIAPGSPWQNGFAERLIGSIRRECVDHIVVLGETHLRRVLKSYARYYNKVRTHRSLDKDAPIPRPIQRTGSIMSHALLGGLHHLYARV